MLVFGRDGKGQVKAADLGLIPPAYDVAAEFEQAFPHAVFTSGRRDVTKQAHDMAVDMLASGLGARWIVKTYAPSKAKDLCVAAVCDLTVPLTVASVSSAIENALTPLTDEERYELSHHLGGAAFDVQPVNVSLVSWGAAALVWLADKAKAVGGKFITNEGGLIRWHFEYPLSAAQPLVCS